MFDQGVARLIADQSWILSQPWLINNLASYQTVCLKPYFKASFMVITLSKLQGPSKLLSRKKKDLYIKWLYHFIIIHCFVLFNEAFNWPIPAGFGWPHSANFTLVTKLISHIRSKWWKYILRVYNGIFVVFTFNARFESFWRFHVLQVRN